jgi:SAM-dependent methyltransferase
MQTSWPRWSHQTNGRQYWAEQGRRFPRSFFGAPTTQHYLAEEKRLFRQHFGDLRGKPLLKLDLWNEAQNTEILLWAVQQGATGYGIDIAETTVRKALARGRTLDIPLEIAVADATRLPFLDNSFECVYTMGTIEHLPGPEPALKELARVLKPGGTAIVGVPNRRDPFLFFVASYFLQALGRYPYGFERWYTNGELRQQLANQGLRVVSRDGILFLPWWLRFLDLYLWVRRPASRYLTRQLLVPFRILARFRGLARQFGYLTVCVARK